MLKNKLKFFITVLVCLLISACASVQKSRTAKFQKVKFEDIQDWHKDKHSIALKTFLNSCEKFLNQEVEKPVSTSTQLGGNIIDWQVPCMEANMLDANNDVEAKRFFERWFDPYKVQDDSGNIHGTLTGYFEIELAGHTKPSDKYKYPIYKKPSYLDSMKGSSSIDHSAINNGQLANQNLEMVWVDNRARLYMMHIQGSGVVKLADGKEMRLGFDGHNGYRFQGISDALKQRNLKFESTKAMVDWLHKNPEMCKEIIEEDPSYVFFRKVDAKSAIGGHGTLLRTERSLAVDYALYPYGAPIWVDVDLPESKAYKSGKYSRLFISQDTGGAIRGPIRGDVFFGRGKKAEEVAGQFKAKGKFFVLFPKTVNVPDTYTAQ
jgi:membrane-bound lytic murein transglycosylase A